MMIKHAQKITFIVFLMLVALTPSLQAAQPKDSGYEAFKAWINAAEAGKRKKLEELHKKIDVGDWHRYGNTALSLSASKGHLDCVKYLVEQGVGTKYKDKPLWKVFHLSAREGHLEVVKYLVEKGVHVKAKAYAKGTALMFSAYDGHLEVVKYLVEQGADIHHKNGDNNTALIMSASEGHLFSLCKVSLAAGSRYRGQK